MGGNIEHMVGEGMNRNSCTETAATSTYLALGREFRDVTGPGGACMDASREV